MYTAGGDHHRLDPAMLVEVHAVDADHAVVRFGIAERTAVIDDVPAVVAGDVEQRVMAGAGGDLRILLQDLADALERPQR